MHGEGYQAYDSIISKAMAYPLCITTFTKTECDKIQATYMSTALQKIGFMGTTKHALIFGPEEYGGLESVIYGLNKEANMSASCLDILEMEQRWAHC
jgi:hypothetical protein